MWAIHRELLSRAEALEAEKEDLACCRPPGFALGEARNDRRPREGG